MYRRPGVRTVIRPCQRPPKRACQDACVNRRPISRRAGRSCASDGSAATSTTENLASKVRVSVKPKFGSTDVAPTDPITLTVFSAKIKDLTVTGDDGSVVTGTISADQATWTLGQRLAYNTTYTFAGTAIASDDGSENPISGTMATIKPADTVRASFQIPSGTTVGVAAPVIITLFPESSTPAISPHLVHVGS